VQGNSYLEKKVEYHTFSANYVLFTYFCSMKKMIDYILSLVYLVYFGLLLVVFHVFQLIAFTIFGRNAQQKVVFVLNFFITYGWYITGTTVKFTQMFELPTGRSIIFVTNHQSTFDIPAIYWFLRKHQPIFVSKIELAKGIPSISYNLRKSKAALIDRKDGKQAVNEILRLSKYIGENNYSAVIFPEGTRSRTGEMKPFAAGGINALLKKAPNALVVPIAIKGNNKFDPKGGLFPLVSFSKLSWTVLEPIEPKGKTGEEIANLAHEAIRLVMEV
jgi:1-acyl-sn-glycerol-3-phosphate acyltransferase